ncbi:hypothetical protein DENIS_1564 [Desulfonema ishimotonii]|uniref:DUF3187 domain-containing protein n=1 Tax=Desulfonema ishimotonii TaxID=45657 RepID=A0A401FUE1_9BACT|nr:DUF3187 family protein [Desulfonema ishimotonii]GBC60607.1 hypothetical protein DENIS_1564 [Desulfonema ishimotonii]
MKIRFTLCAFWLMLFIFLHRVPLSQAGSSGGPLQVQNRYPPHLMFLTPLPDGPDLPGNNRFETAFSVDYSSVNVNEKSAGWTALIDMEMTVLSFSLAYGLSDRLSVGLYLPLVSMSGGFMDNFLEDYHDTFGFPNYGREDRPKNSFAYSITKDGKDWFQARDNGLHLGESVVSAKYSLWDERRGDRFSATLAYALKLPTGDADRGFGSGGYDHAVSLLSRARFKALAVYLNAGFSILSDPDTLGADISACNIFSMLLGGEYLLNDKWSLLSQLNFYTSPLDEDTGISQLDNESLELSLGCLCRITPDVDFEFAFCEDLTRAAPDFTIHAGIRCRFGF